MDENDETPVFETRSGCVSVTESFSSFPHHFQLILLNEQQLVDCDPYNSGCEGGWPTDAWDYPEIFSRWICTGKQSLYPYTATVMNDDK